MNHRDHVALIEGGIGSAGGRWLELGAGNGEFTLALAQCLGEGGEIVAVDLDRWALDDLDGRVSSRFPGVRVETIVLDFTEDTPAGPFDGVLAANSLHFTTDPVAVLQAARAALEPGGRLVVVEYDAEHGNPYVPHPISARRLPGIAAAAGFTAPLEIGRVPSRFLGAIYAAVAGRAADG